MGRVRRKLKSQRGASLMVALLFFVMMAVIGSVILAAASAGMGRVKDEDEGDQERYALYSAAKMIEKAFAGQDVFPNKVTNNKFTISAPLISYYIDVNDMSTNKHKYSNAQLSSDYTVPSDIWSDSDFEQTTVPPTANKLSEIPEKLAERIIDAYWAEEKANVEKWNFGSTKSWSDVTEDAEYNDVLREQQVHFTITPDKKWAEKAEGEAEAYTIRADLNMDKNFNITVKLKLKDTYKANQTYIVKVPFDSNAKVQLGMALRKEDPQPVYVTPNDPTSNISTYSQRVTENRTVIFSNFQWEDDKKVTITTVVPDSESLTPTPVN